jgi:hypothetical protein
VVCSRLGFGTQHADDDGVLDSVLEACVHKV